MFFSILLDMEAECSDDVMKLRVKFNATFSGLIYSAGKQQTCLYAKLSCIVKCTVITGRFDRETNASITGQKQLLQVGQLNSSNS